MNPLLNKLQPYPFERQRALLAGVQPDATRAPISLSIGEPRHPTPAVVRDALAAALDGLAQYPPTAGSVALREAIAGWLQRRYGVRIDAAREVLPVNGSREALFAFAQTVLDASADAIVISPNPFYQIYEGAALLGGATPWFVDQRAERGFHADWGAVPEAVWQRTALVYTCSPANPTGAVMALDEWRTLFELSDRYGFAIASDECYSEIYFEEGEAPLGALQAARQLGRDDWRRLVMFSSLSKRSNAPGLRSGFVAGDATLLEKFLLYRTYHGGAMSPPVQAASIAAWNDEEHVVDNRRRYREKFAVVTPRLSRVLRTSMPQAGFYLWAAVPGGDETGFVRELYRQYNVLTLPGSFLARAHDGRNPGAGYVRIALVDDLASCLDATERIESFLASYRPSA